MTTMTYSLSNDLYRVSDDTQALRVLSPDELDQVAGGCPLLIVAAIVLAGAAGYAVGHYL